VFLLQQHCDLLMEAVQRMGYWLHGPGFETQQGKCFSLLPNVQTGS